MEVKKAQFKTLIKNNPQQLRGKKFMEALTGTNRSLTYKYIAKESGKTLEVELNCKDIKEAMN